MGNRKGSARLALTTIALAAVMVAGCSNSSEPVVAESSGGSLADDAKREGALVWYAGQTDAQIDAQIAGFNKLYPEIKIETVRASASKLTQRFQAGAEVGEFPDLITTSQADFYSQAAAKGWLAPLDQEHLPALEAFPKDFVSADGTTIAWVAAPQVAVYNTDRVTKDEIPTKWEDLLKPEFKDEIILADPRNVTAYKDLMNTLYDEFGPDFLTKFRQQNPSLVDSSVPGLQALAAGEAKILLPTLESNITKLKSDGAPLEVLGLAPTKGIEILAAASAKAPHPAAARLFLDYLVSKEGQLAGTLEGMVSPIGVTEASFPEGYQRPDFAAAAKRSDELLSLLGLK